jgi:O-antigen ligase
VQNAYIQALADLGPLGLLAFLAATLGPAALALRRGRRPEAVAGAALLLVALGVWNGFGLVSGIPLDALTWLAAGVALASVAFVHDSITQRV